LHISYHHHVIWIFERLVVILLKHWNLLLRFLQSSVVWEVDCKYKKFKRSWVNSFTNRNSKTHLNGHLVLWLWVRFTCSHIYCCLVKQKTQFFTSRTHHKPWLCRRFKKAAFCCFLHGEITWTLYHSPLFSEQWRHSPLFQLDRVRSKAKNALNRSDPIK